MVTDDELMGLALDEARSALGHGDVPIGAVVVVDGVVVARRHNERECSHSILDVMRSSPCWLVVIQLPPIGYLTCTHPIARS